VFLTLQLIIVTLYGALQVTSSSELLLNGGPVGMLSFFGISRRSGSLQTLVVKCAWQSLQVWDDIGCSLISGWQRVSTVSTASTAPALRSASSPELDAWAQYMRAFF